MLLPDAFFARHTYGPPKGQPYADPRIGLSKVPEWTKQCIDEAVECPVEDRLRLQQTSETRRDYENAPVNEDEDLPIMDIEEAETYKGSRTIQYGGKEHPKDHCYGEDPVSPDNNLADTMFDCGDEELSETRILGVRYTYNQNSYTMRVLEGGDGVVWSDLDAMVQAFQPDLHYTIPKWQAFLSLKQHQIRAKSVLKFIKLGLQKALLVYTFAALEFLSNCGPPVCARILRRPANYARLTEANRPV